MMYKVKGRRGKRVIIWNGTVYTSEAQVKKEIIAKGFSPNMQQYIIDALPEVTDVEEATKRLKKLNLTDQQIENYLAGNASTDEDVTKPTKKSRKRKSSK